MFHSFLSYLTLWPAIFKLSLSNRPRAPPRVPQAAFAPPTALVFVLPTLPDKAANSVPKDTLVQIVKLALLVAPNVTKA